MPSNMRPKTRAVSLVEVSDVCTLVVRRYLKSTPGAGGSLFEDQGNVAAGEHRLLVATDLGGLELGGQRNEPAQFIGG
jgi:hypothetical protein